MSDYRKLALVYLAIPAALFLYGWFTPWVALPLVLGIFYCIYTLPSFKVAPLPKRVLFALLACIVAWVFISGIGGFVFQNPDHPYRNAVLRDLVENEWPVIYSDSAAEDGRSLLCYYFAYWLPSAIVGKAAGLAWAQCFLFVWSVVGVFLFCRILAVLHPRHALLVLLFLIICSGLDVIPYAATHLADFRPWCHLEVYCPWQYSSPTTCLFWVYNQAIPAWICVALLLSTPLSLAQKVFVSSLLFCLSPFPFIGFVLYVAIEHCVVVVQQIHRAHAFKQCLVAEIEALFNNRQWIYCCVGCVFAYIASSFMGCTGRELESFFFYRFDTLWYVVFCIVEFALPCSLMLRYGYKVREVSVILCILAVIPFFQIISFKDYVMRVSMVPLMLMYVYFFSFIIVNRHKRLLVTICLSYIAIGAVIPMSEMLRTVKQTCLSPVCTSYVEDLKPHPNFNSKTYQQSKYGKYLMKK